MFSPAWCLAFVSALVAAEVPKVTRELNKNRFALEVRDRRMTGQGARLLERELAEAQYVMFGEQHATHEIPLFAEAVCAAFRPDAIAIEAGQFVTKEIPRLSADFLARYPDSIAFYAWTEEIGFVKTCQAAGAHWVWGLDQEFLGSAAYLLTEIALTKPGKAAEERLNQLMSKCAALDNNARASGNYAEICLTNLPASDLRHLDQAMGNNRRGREALAALSKSQHIYGLNTAGRGYESNLERAQYLKSQFAKSLEAATRKKARPKVLLKFGDNHALRGWNFLNISDLGNFVSENAAREGVASLHISVMGINGEVLRPTGFGKPPKVVKAGGSGVKDILAQSALEGTWTLLDVRPLRRIFASLEADREIERLIFGTDLLILIPTVSPAHPLDKPALR